VETYRRHPGAAAAAVGLTVLSQVCYIGGAVLIGLGLGLGTPWYLYFVCLPLIQIVSSVPLTPGAVGVLEKLYQVYFTVGCTGSQALALAVLVRAAMVAGALPGAWVAAFGTGLHPPEAPSQDSVG
jgi:uncharacterized membrane protein YbhN (UPF0104 family)